jgi:uncharacterized protein (DUF488 family)
MTINLQVFQNLISQTKTQQSFVNYPQLFTIGYEGVSINDYLEKLIEYDIHALIDVRSNPLSRKPGFSKTSFREHLEKVSIKYFHIPELGVPSALRKNLNSRESYESLFEYYSSEILPSNIDSLEKVKSILLEYSRVALTCFEADYQMCHRHKITEYLDRESSFKGTIIHLN